jgi:hypothetical protein
MSRKVDECKPLPYTRTAGFGTAKHPTAKQGLTLGLISAQLELFCPPCNPT